MTLWYAGFGSRETPRDVCDLMTGVAKVLRSKGMRCRSGGAKGADKAFEKGDPDTLVLRPEHATMASLEIASKFHPKWGRCSGRAQKLLGRNVPIMLGPEFNEYAEFGICWTYPDNTRGGTVHGMRICEGYGIEVRNLAEPEWLKWAERIVNG